MKRLIRYLALGVGVGFVTLVLSLTSARPALAQLGQPTHQAILDAINSLSASVNSALTGIQASLNTLAAEGQSNVRVTPPLVGVGGEACMFVNVSDTPKTVTFQLWEGGSHTIRATDTRTVDPGVAAEIRGGLHGVFYCVFTVQNGSKSDIRGSIQVNSDPNIEGFGPGITSLSAE